MALGTLLDQALHSATVVPRLSAAAMKAGVGPRGTVEVLRISEAALRTLMARRAGAEGGESLGEGAANRQFGQARHGCAGGVFHIRMRHAARNL